MKRARSQEIIAIETHDIRAQATDSHNTVDDSPYGGGPGMVLKVEPIIATLRSIKRKNRSKVILLSPRGKQFTQKDAAALATEEQLIFICGRYEGIDERVIPHIDEAYSIGPYVLSGGELPAMVIIEAVSRHIPGFLGKEASLDEETFSDATPYEYPQYTRPEVFEGIAVPEVLLSGNHKEIAAWRKMASKPLSISKEKTEGRGVNE